jgi:hypothetical protein
VHMHYLYVPAASSVASCSSLATELFSSFVRILKRSRFSLCCFSSCSTLHKEAIRCACYRGETVPATWQYPICVVHDIHKKAISTAIRTTYQDYLEALIIT